MTKSNLLSNLSQANLTEDLLHEIESYLAEFPEELSEENVLEINSFLSDMQQIELKYAQTNEEIAEAAQEHDEDVTNNFLDTVNGSVKAAATELRNASDMLDVIDPPAGE